ncbi:(R)-mandelonitrile lyase [Janthinobacterium lividum]|uniref:Cupin domain-containing protein n=1 Tax=Janthinobacterium lividum TaxID=29581 RepID=A0ABU0XM75_9BURK|nr:cupin domain-containing protein [Janthinobacterium lividum]MDQ4624313.1 cupin domain-containing protein [Janthinobacterium lividum]MDQ4674083.1 cupin domain-containing protein [Janthinobacterium lividum]MDQ4684813.1 cupin domain-containing protein [Janthinobacterium lividum]
MHRYAAALLPLCLPAGAVSASASAEAAATRAAVTVTRAAAMPTITGDAAYFTGTVEVDAMFQRLAPARVGGGIVTFAPGARTAWHTHPLGQTLIVTQGSGWVQHWQGPLQALAVGDVAWIPPGVKHWHGATATSAMQHVAIAEAQDGTAVTWLEQVADDSYPR